MRKSTPTRALRENPDLNQLKRQAKELLKAFTGGDAKAVAEINSHYRGADPARFALHDAQLVLARAYGFESWPKLKARVDGVTAQRLAEAVRCGDMSQVRALLKARPELVNMDMAADNEHRALHFAVLARKPEMVRVLMEHGADARKGIYPHRDATSALTLATERGYDEIVAIIQQTAPKPDDPPSPQSAESAAHAAVAAGDVDWLRARHAAGELDNPIEASGGLLTHAVQHDRPEILMLLLDFGFDPNERTRVEGLDEVTYSAGMPLWHCAVEGKYAMAEILLSRGADPNAGVYASGSAMHQAYGRQDPKMIELLERHGGVAGSTTAGLYRLTALARRMLAGEVETALAGNLFAGKTAAEQLLWAAACGGDPEIVRMALDQVDWPRNDRRWYTILEQPTRVWNHGAGHWCHNDWDRGTYLTCFRLVLARCDANVGGRFGLTMLHHIAASRRHVTADERLAFATMLLDAGARLDARDHLLMSTPLGWACRWGRVELVKLLLERGADPVEADAEPWATPRAWAEKMGHGDVRTLLD